MAQQGTRSEQSPELTARDSGLEGQFVVAAWYPGSWITGAFYGHACHPPIAPDIILRQTAPSPGLRGG